MNLVSIIIPVYQNHDLTYECIQQLREVTDPSVTPYELILIDNGSDPIISPPFTGHIETTLIRNESNLGFPKAVNQGIQTAKGDMIVLLNNDVFVTPKWLEKLTIGLIGFDIVGPVTNYCAGLQRVQIEPYNSIPDLNDSATQWADYCDGEIKEVNFVIGFCMAFEKSLYEEVGEFDESLWPCSGEEIDFCLGARKLGHSIAILMDCYVHHEGSKTFKLITNDKEYNEICKRNDEHLTEKWGKDFWLKQDINSSPSSTSVMPSIPQVKDKVIRLNLGCGPFRLSGFTNIDQFDFVHPDLVCDVIDLPYEPNSVHEIYAGHLLEHFKFKEGMRALKYWHSLLVDGGVIGITVPDYDFLCKQYVADPSPENLIIFNDYFIYSGIQPSPHQYAYSADLLYKVMVDVGFKDIMRMPIDHPYFPEAVEWQVGFMGVK